MHKADASTQAGLRALGKAIRAERKRRAVSQDALAELAEVHANYIGRVERAEINLSFDSLQRIAGALRLSVAELCGLAGV